PSAGGGSLPCPPLLLTGPRRLSWRPGWASRWISGRRMQADCAGRSGQPRVPSMSASVDRLLQGGLSLCQLTELAGSAGSGKTQLCMQLCASCSCLPRWAASKAAPSIWTPEGSFSRQAAGRRSPSGLLLHCRRLADANAAAASPPGDDDDGNGVEGAPESAKRSQAASQWSRSCQTYTTFAACPTCSCARSPHESLERFFSRSPARPANRAGLHRLAVFATSSTMRDRGTASSPSSPPCSPRLAVSCRLAVLCTNQMTTRFGLTDAADSRVEPALGPSWCHVCNIRLVIERLEGGGGGGGCEDQRRRMRVLKHPAVRAGSSAVFQVCAVGVRDAFQDDVS
uniref:Rad51 domain-containing protein n=1 Tax=Macrostomum lignano TaxID=282301 RepID=A0A1I8FFC7_9PLAT